MPARSIATNGNNATLRGVLPLTGGTLTGSLLFSADNTHDIGASGATRPRDLFLGRNLLAGGSVTVGSSSAFAFLSRTVLQATADGTLLVSNNAATDFTRLMFGGTTSSFPALERASEQFKVMLADGSGGTALSGRYLSVASNGYFGFGSTTTPGSSVDAAIVRASQGVLIYTNNQGSPAGVSLDFNTDSILKVRNRANGADAAITASTLTTTGGGAFTITQANSVSPTAPNRTITISVAGTTYYLAAKTTND
jgi:hypothetical protein